MSVSIRALFFGAAVAILASTAWLHALDEPSSTETSPPAQTGSSEPSPPLAHEIEQPTNRSADAATTAASTGEAKDESRDQSYARVMVAAHLGNAQQVTPESVRAFWMAAADRGAPTEALDTLLQIARDNADDERLAGAALDYREDLLRLRDRAEPESAVPTLAVEELGEAPYDEDEVDDGHWIELDRLDDINDALRYSSDDAAVSGAIDELALHREDIVADALIEAAEHPGADQRRSAVTALWRAAADGVDSSDPGGVRHRLELARYDSDPRTAALAAIAIDDLDAAAEAALTRDSRQEDASPGCPPEICDAAAL